MKGALSCVSFCLRISYKKAGRKNRFLPAFLFPFQLNTTPEIVHKPHMRHFDCPAVEVLKLSCVRLKLEFQFVGTQRLRFIPRRTVGCVDAVFSVAQQRMPDGCEMRPDLMGAPCQQLYLQKG